MHPEIIDIKPDPLRLVKAVVAIDDEPLSVLGAGDSAESYERFRQSCIDYLGFEESSIKIEMIRSLDLMHGANTRFKVTGESSDLYLPIGEIHIHDESNYDIVQRISRFKQSCVMNLGFDHDQVSMFVYSIRNSCLSGICISEPGYYNMKIEVHEV